MEVVIWLLSCILSAAAGFVYGKHLEALKSAPKQYDSLKEEDLDNQKDLTLYKEEPKDSEYLREELKRERETKRKQVDEYEKEITYLKGLIDKNQKHFDDKIVRIIQERHESTQKLFDEMNNELGVSIQIVDSENNISDEEINKAIDSEINLHKS